MWQMPWLRCLVKLSAKQLQGLLDTAGRCQAAGTYIILLHGDPYFAMMLSMSPSSWHLQVFEVLVCSTCSFRGAAFHAAAFIGGCWRYEAVQDRVLNSRSGSAGSLACFLVYAFGLLAFWPRGLPMVAVALMLPEPNFLGSMSPGCCGRALSQPRSAPEGLLNFSPSFFTFDLYIGGRVGTI